MPLFGFPMLNINSLIYNGAEWLTNQAEGYGGSLFELVGLRQSSQGTEASQGLVPLIGDQSADPQQPTNSELGDRQYDFRHDGIEQLRADAAAMGKQLPEEFEWSMNNCKEPKWLVNDQTREMVNIFEPDGSINEIARRKFLIALSNGELEKECSSREKQVNEWVAGQQETRTNLIETVEQATGKELNATVKAELIKDGSFSYKEDGKYREINLSFEDQQAINGEIAEAFNKYADRTVVDVNSASVSEAVVAQVNAVKSAVKSHSRT